ncbi:MAG: LacI family DNA-binding transcriptional regulator [Chloroflexota bacterium]|nr:LacI family DNA-binding transcriptional regulator [Chloroflexota bacterium]
MNNRVTIEDVAKAAGVSRQTVSRVLNHKSDVSDETRHRILQIIDQLGYRPSRIARGLATDRTGTFGLVFPDVANPYFAEIVRGAEDVARERDNSVFLCNTDENPQRELTALRSLDAQQVDGILLCSPRLNDDELRSLIPRLPPLVLVNHLLRFNRRPVANDRLSGSGQQLSPASTEQATGQKGVMVSAVLVDDGAGSAAAVKHLWARGHRHIGLLAGPSISHSSQRRIQGYSEQLVALADHVDSALIRYCQATAAGGQQAAAVLLTDHPEITALVTYNDLVAAGALRACRTLNRRVPEDVAIVGCDDIYMASLVTPELTTLRVSGRALGQEAMRLLLSDLAAGNGTDRSREIWMRPTLVVRESAP